MGLSRRHRLSPSTVFTGRAMPRAVAGSVAGLALILLVVGIDLMGAARDLAAEGPPRGGGVYWIRSLVLAVGSGALVFGLRELVVEHSSPSNEPDHPLTRPAAAIGVFLALGAVTLLIWDPSTLSTLVREDHLVEWLSAGLAFVAAGLLIVAALRHDAGVAPRLLLLGMAGLCLLLGLEEISWFQRVLDVESPEFMINRNGQQELNLHNLATDVTGNFYFVGGFIALTLIPAIVGDRKMPQLPGSIQGLWPSRLVLVGAAPAAGFVYEMWNIIWIQSAFWMTLAALLVAARHRRQRPIVLTVAAATGLTAVAFLVLGDTMVRGWDDTEIRELLLPYGLVLYSHEMVGRTTTTNLLTRPTAEQVRTGS